MYYIWLNKIHNSIFKFSFILDLMFFSTPGASTNLNPLLTVSILSISCCLSKYEQILLTNYYFTVKPIIVIILFL